MSDLSVLSLVPGPLAEASGPFVITAPGQLQLTLAAHHLNRGAGLHGGLAMTLLVSAFDQLAATLPGADGTPARRLANQFDFIDSAGAGTTVTATASVTRATRSILFLEGNLYEGERLLLTARATYRRAAVPAVESPPSAQQRPDGTTALGTQPDSYSNVILNTYALAQPDGRETGYYQTLDQRHLDGEGRIHDGVLLSFADISLGRTARRASGMGCVTLGLRVEYHHDAEPESVICLTPDVRSQAGSHTTITAEIHSGDRLLATFGTLWKGVRPG